MIMKRDLAAHESKESSEPTLSSTDATSLRPARQRYTMSGVLSLGMLIEIMQVIHHMRMSGELVLEIHSSTPRIFFKDGQVISVAHRGDQKDAIEAFNAILRSCEGAYHFIKSDVSRISQSIDMDCQHLILQALTKIDEESGS